MAFWNDIADALTGQGAAKKTMQTAVDGAKKKKPDDLPIGYDLTDQIILGMRRGQAERLRAQTGRTRAAAFGSPYQYGGQYPILLGGA